MELKVIQLANGYIGYIFNDMEFIIHQIHVDVWETIWKPCSCMQFKGRIFYYKVRENQYQYYKSRENLYQVLHVT